MMARFAALLGSINVGGNRLKMADLVAAMETRGFQNVATVVASGNLLFDHESAPDAELENRIAAILKDEFQIDSVATVRSAEDLAASRAENPFAGEGEDKFVHVHFLTGQPTAAQFSALIADHEGRGPERLAPGTRALHIDFVSSVGSSKLTRAFIERRLGCRGTARNVRSLNRIIEKLS